MRYQQKQRDEMERKRNEYVGSRSTRIPGLELNNDSNKIHIGNGKVCILPPQYTYNTLDLVEQYYM